MREILFRGKREDNRQWIKGYYCGPGHLDTHEICDIDDILLTRYEVAPETVGQYTGLTDKYRKKIFEEDVICYITPDGIKAIGAIRFGQYGTGGTVGVGFYVEWVGRYGAGWLRQDIGFWAKCRDIEIIGNIHDNPELMEGDT